ncbi:hypothetical protein EROM_061120 [Encephalitozoon romaleae SJ-2008]|uniref:Uncharacterized protein n=1 Tax=Encephalitozoon romaleae (strain SJ-2008) TaxID=1178016 RepID=I7AN89_ENCRO|nr:hypothetical protein EROM_061120 [Encephalitozoon romaleae SJ-2008]AFN83204.1 hypothetical protein EROM_061120 [Encephalitozoon romaleae SJ-2008]
MQKAIELVTSEIRSTHDSEAIERWYLSYLERKACPESMFGDVLSITMPDIESSDILKSTAMLFEASQKATDEMSLRSISHSYENSMEIISIFTIYNSIFPIIERHIKDKILGSKVVDVYNDASMHLNGPREGTQEILEGRRRFFFDFYIPVKIYLVCTGKSHEIKDKEKKFVMMYLAKKRGDGWCEAHTNQFYEEMSNGEEKVRKALEFLFSKAY